MPLPAVGGKYVCTYTSCSTRRGREFTGYISNRRESWDRDGGGGQVIPGGGRWPQALTLRGFVRGVAALQLAKRAS